MSKYISVDSQIIYDRFVNNLKEYEKDKIIIKKDKTKSKLFFGLLLVYLAICIGIYIESKTLSNEIFGGMTTRKMVLIYIALLIIFWLFYISVIPDFISKKEYNLSTLSLLKALNDEKILDSENKLEIIDLLYEKKDEVGPVYTKLFNIIKNSVVVVYSKWLIGIFIGLFTGIISSTIINYIEKEAEKNLVNYIYLIGKSLVYTLLLILIISFFYYILFHLVDKDQNRKHDLYVLGLKNIKYILLQENKEIPVQILIENPKEYFMVNNAENNTDNGNKKLKKSDRYLHLFLILSIIFISSTFVYIIVYFNFDSKLVRSPKLLLFFYIILIFINLIFRILNNLLYPDSNRNTNMFHRFKKNLKITNWVEQYIEKFSKKINWVVQDIVKLLKILFFNYIVKLYIIIIISKLLMFLNSIKIDNTESNFYQLNNFVPDSIFILIILIIIYSTIKQISNFSKNSKILEKCKSNRSKSSL